MGTVVVVVKLFVKMVVVAVARRRSSSHCRRHGHRDTVAVIIDSLVCKHSPIQRITCRTKTSWARCSETMWESNSTQKNLYKVVQPVGQAAHFIPSTIRDSYVALHIPQAQVQALREVGIKLALGTMKTNIYKMVLGRFFFVIPSKKISKFGSFARLSSPS